MVVWQKNLVGQRGLMPDSDQQTFSISVQPQLRAEYNRILMPISAARVSKRLHILFTDDVQMLGIFVTYLILTHSCLLHTIRVHQFDGKS